MDSVRGAVIAGGVGPEEKAACKSRTRTMRVRAGAVGKASREVAVPAIDISNHSGETNRDSFQQASARSLRRDTARSEEHTSELQSLMRLSYAVFCLKKTKHTPS